MLFSAKQVAKYFIWKSILEKKPITNKKLQKLLYYAQAWTYTLKGKPLFKEDIQAWVHGPTIVAVYDEYKKFGFNPISTNISEQEVKEIKDNDILEDVWRIYGKNYDADYLEKLTHSEAPWQNARQELSPSERSANVISLEDMKKFYSTFL